MATVLQFTPVVPSTTCPRCEGKGYEAEVFNPFVGEVVAVPCGKCEGTGQFTALANAEGEVRYWRSRYQSAERRPRARKERQQAAEQLEFWTGKVAIYSAMRKA